MVDNPIYNPAAGPNQKSQAYKTAEYQTVKGLRFAFRWVGVGIRSTVKLFGDMLHQLSGR